MSELRLLDEPDAPPVVPPTRRIRRSSLWAHGEPMTWLTGGALAVALSMIVCLLGYIVVEGVRTFWPQPLEWFQTLDGNSYLGEIAREDNYEPLDEALDDLDPAIARRARAHLRARQGVATRWLVRTGNFDITGTHYEWIEDFILAKRSMPGWAMAVERVAWGRFHGIPKGFLVDGRSKAESPKKVWELFNLYHPQVRQRRSERQELERHAEGDIHRRVDDARLALRRIELASGRSSADWRKANGAFQEAQRETNAQFAAVRKKISALNKQNARYKLVLGTASGEDVSLELADIVRAYPANRLSWSQKVGVYTSRWVEFLVDEPREANSEGGVFPAIFGTVVMTLLMALAVVPFGVLAALYLREYAKAGLVTTAVRIAISNLAGVPSIVFGVFGLGFFCYIVGGYIDRGPADAWQPSMWFVLLGAIIVTAVAAAALAWLGGRRGRSRAWWMPGLTLLLWLVCIGMTLVALATTPFFSGFFAAELPNPTFGKGGLIWASFTLALLTLPVVIVASEEALAAVPNSMREGSYACGASKWQTIWRIVLPRAMPGIMTGMILAMSRGAGEVAPLMLVGAAKLAPELPVDTVAPFFHPQRSFMHLGFHVFDLGFQSQNSEAAKPMVFTTTLLLISIIAFLNITAVWVRSGLRRRYKTSHF